MNKQIILLLIPLIAISCTPQKEKITGTWICGNYLDSAAAVMLLTDSSVWNLNSYTAYQTAKISISNSQIAIDSGYFTPFDDWRYALPDYSGSKKLSYKLQNNVLHLFDHDNSHLEFRRCDSLTKQQQVFAGKLLLIDLPTGFNYQNDELNCPYEIYVGKPKSLYRFYIDSSTYPYAIQLNDDLHSIADIRDFVASSGKYPSDRAVILADKDTPMSIIHEIKKSCYAVTSPTYLP